MVALSRASIIAATDEPRGRHRGGAAFVYPLGKRKPRHFKKNFVSAAGFRVLAAIYFMESKNSSGSLNVERI
jgi:hypothetical protein